MTTKKRESVWTVVHGSHLSDGMPFWVTCNPDEAPLCEAWALADARKIARALNAAERKRGKK